jgi:hypothetical protein
VKKSEINAILNVMRIDDLDIKDTVWEQIKERILFLADPLFKNLNNAGKKECPQCRGKGEIMVKKPFLRDIDGSEDIGGTPYPEMCPRCKGKGVI